MQGSCFIVYHTILNHLKARLNNRTHGRQDRTEQTNNRTYWSLFSQTKITAKGSNIHPCTQHWRRKITHPDPGAEDYQYAVQQNQEGQEAEQQEPEPDENVNLLIH